MLSWGAGLISSCCDICEVRPTPSFFTTLLVQILPCVGTIEFSHGDVPGVLPGHHPHVDGNPAIVVFLNTFIMRGATTGFAVVELYTAIAPQVGLL